MAAPFTREPGPGQRDDGEALVQWAERTGRRSRGVAGRGGLRFAFYGRVSTEDWQDPVTSRTRQREQARVLVAGHGTIVAEFFDSGHSRTLPWARRPQAAALVAALADPDRRMGRDRDRGIRAGVLRQPVRVDGPVVRALRRLAVAARGRRAGRLARRRSRADHAGIGLVVQAGDYPDQDPGAHRDGRPDPGAGPVPGRSAAVRVPAGRCGPHPNKAHAAWGRRAHRLEPDP